MATRRRLLVIGSTCGTVLIFLVVAAATLSCNAVPPSQPILFSHRLHAGELKLDCEFCHYYARRSVSAGVPSVRYCMGCHELIDNGSSELEKLRGHWDLRQPIVWTKVYDLPDHVVFSHQQHVQADVACEQCHGSIETMDQVQRTEEGLTMGWCLQCHKERKVSLDCLSCHY